MSRRPTAWLRATLALAVLGLVSGLAPVTPSVAQEPDDDAVDAVLDGLDGSLYDLYDLYDLDDGVGAVPDGADLAVAPTVAIRLTDLAATLGPGAVRLEGSGRNGDLEELNGPDGASTAPPPQNLRMRVLVEHHGDIVLDEVRVIVEVHPPAASRGGLRVALDDPAGLEESTALHVHEADVRGGDDLEPGDIAGLDIEIAADQVAWAEDGGVHPVRVAVVRGATVLDEVTTAAIWLEEPPERPLLTAALWPLDTEPWRAAGPSYPRGIDRAVRAGGAIDAQLRALERHPGSDVLLAPPAHLLEDLGDRGDGFVRTERVDGGALESRAVDAASDVAVRSEVALQRLRDAIDAAPAGPLARPYAEADLGALVGDEDARPLAGELARSGRSRLEDAGGRRSDQRTYLLPAGTGDEVLDLVPADTVMVPYEAIEGPDPTANPTLPSPVRDTTSAGGRPVTLLVGDPYVSSLLTTNDTDRPIIASQRVLAETAMVFFEAPGIEDRPLSIHPPEAWQPTTELAQRLLGQLRDAPWLRLSDAQTVVNASGPREPATLAPPAPATLESEQRVRLLDALEDLAAASQARRGLPALVDADEEDDGLLAGRDPQALRDGLLRSTSRWYPPDAETSDGLLRDVESALESTLTDVTVASGTSVTLTSDTGTIPVTLQRGDGGPLDVRVEVASQARLTWPEGAESEVLRLEEGSAQTVTFATRALSTGDFSVTVRVTDPTGRLELDRTTLSVRSTAVSGPALSLIAGLVVILLLVGGLRRGPRQRRLEVVR